MNATSYERGAVSPLVVTTVLLTVLTVGLLGFGVWAFVNYLDNKNNVDAKVAEAVTVAKKAQTDEDEKSFLEREKLPTRKATGPADLGGLTFSYPKTWSMYVDKDGTSGTYQAYLNPGQVLPTAQKATANAIAVSVEDRKYEDVLTTFKDVVAKGDLRASPITVVGQTGTRLDGNFTKDVKGAAIFFKVRDKTLRIMAQSNDYLGDFNNIILPSLQFNP